MTPGTPARSGVPSVGWLIWFLVWTGPGCIVTIAVLHAEQPRFLQSLIQDLPPIGNASVAWALVWWSVGIGLFTAGCGLAGRMRATGAGPMSTVHLPHDRAVAAAIASAGMWAAIVVLSAKIGFGVLGEAVPSVPLPLRVVLSRGPVLLSAVIIAVYAATRDARFRVLILGASFVPILLATWLTASRGAAVLFLAPFILVEFHVADSLHSRRRVIAALGVFAFAMVLAYPVITQHRAALGFGGGVSASNSGLDVTGSAFKLLLRPQGATGALYLTDGRIPNDPTFAPENVVQVYTADVVKVTVPNDFRSPGILAGLYLVGGVAGVVVGMLWLGAGFAVLYRVARTRNLGGAAAAFLTVRAVEFLSEGTLQLQDLLVTALGFFAIIGIGHLVSTRRTVRWV